MEYTEGMSAKGDPGQEDNQEKITHRKSPSCDYTVRVRKRTPLLIILRSLYLLRNRRYWKSCGDDGSEVDKGESVHCDRDGGLKTKMIGAEDLVLARMRSRSGRSFCYHPHRIYTPPGTVLS
jgi:hypothetical protein